MTFFLCSIMPKTQEKGKLIQFYIAFFLHFKHNTSNVDLSNISYLNLPGLDDTLMSQ